MTDSNEPREDLPIAPEKDEATCESELSLLERAKRWYAKGFKQAITDHNQRVANHGFYDEFAEQRYQNEIGIMDTLRSLTIQMIKYIRLPLDTAFAFLDAEVRDDKQEDFILGLGSTEVQAGSTAIINVQPQIGFKPERLVIPSHVGVNFLINDIKVGPNSQFLSVAAVPASVFCELASGNLDRLLRLDACRPGRFITISVVNITVHPRNFTGAFFGPRIED
jgi:hypothetical protein